MFLTCSESSGYALKWRTETTPLLRVHGYRAAFSSLREVFPGSVWSRDFSCRECTGLGQEFWLLILDLCPLLSNNPKMYSCGLSFPPLRIMSRPFGSLAWVARQAGRQQAQHSAMQEWRSYLGSERPVFSFLPSQPANKKLFIASFRHLLVDVQRTIQKVRQQQQECSLSLRNSQKNVIPTWTCSYGYVSDLPSS